MPESPGSTEYAGMAVMAVPAFIFPKGTVVLNPKRLIVEQGVEKDEKNAPNS